MRHAIGIDIGGTKAAITRIDCGGWEVLEKQIFPAPDNCRDYLELLANGIRRLGIAAPVGVGISCGGPLDSREGIVYSPPHLADWDAVPIARRLAAVAQAPAWLQNDANAGALAEWYWGAGQGCQDLVFVTFGTGFGAGIIANGRLLEGRTGQAGEIGHVRLHDQGPEAYGKAGSVEAFCSGGGLEQRYQCRARELFAAARQSQPEALRIVAEIGHEVGSALAILVDLLNPERVVLGGIYARHQDLLAAPVRAGLEAESLPRNAADVEIVAAALGEAIGDYACMAVIRQHGQTISA